MSHIAPSLLPLIYTHQQASTSNSITIHNLTISQSLSFLSYIELCHRSPLSTIPSMINTTSNKRSHAVTFSICSDLYIVPASEQDRSTTWYTSEDKQGFRRSMVKSIRKITRELEELPMGATMTQCQLLNCLGIELLITSGVARSAAEVRRAHIDAILSEQRLQKLQGVCDIDRISSISEERSHWTVERARKLATGYAALSMK